MLWVFLGGSRRVLGHIDCYSTKCFLLLVMDFLAILLADFRKFVVTKVLLVVVWESPLTTISE